MASNKYLTEDEIVSTLAHSSLPTLIVEGKDDMSVYRWIEEDCKETFDIIQCQGRSVLFNIYKRRTEYSNIKVVFVADKDIFVYSEIPKEYSGIIFTNGYSIENDLYYGRKIEELLSRSEINDFQKSIREFCRYYGDQVEKFRSGKDYKFCLTPCSILDSKTNVLIIEKIEGGFSEPSKETMLYLNKEYDVLIRGHSLFSLLFRIFSKRKEDPKYSHHQLFEICYKTMKSEMISNLQEKVLSAFND